MKSNHIVCVRVYECVCVCSLCVQAAVACTAPLYIYTIHSDTKDHCLYIAYKTAPPGGQVKCVPVPVCGWVWSGSVPSYAYLLHALHTRRIETMLHYLPSQSPLIILGYTSPWSKNQHDIHTLENWFEFFFNYTPSLHSIILLTLVL